MNTKYLILPAIIAADYFSKHSEHTGIADHYTTKSIWVFLVFVPLAILAIGRPRYRLPVSVLFAGGLLNYLDSLDGMVVNPYVLIVNTNGIGFNIADLAILVGFIYTVREAVKDKKEKIGSAEWNNA